MFGVTSVLFRGVYRVSALIVRRLCASFLTYRPGDNRQLAALRFLNESRAIDTASVRG